MERKRDERSTPLPTGHSELDVLLHDTRSRVRLKPGSVNSTKLEAAYRARAAQLAAAQEAKEAESQEAPAPTVSGPWNPARGT